MDTLIIEGGHKLYGEVEIQGSKNGVLPILAATILNKGVTVLHHCPRITDVDVMLTILEELGCVYTWSGSRLIVDSTHIETHVVEQDYAGRMRCSIILLGALIGRLHQVDIPFPGGCTIGERPINLHIFALKQMNIEIEVKVNEGILSCVTSQVRGANIHLTCPSVGATENIILAAVTGWGTTTITNAAREPEIVELQHFLNAMGANVQGAGTSVITIAGVKTLHDVEYHIVPDRIVSGTYMMAVLGTGGEIALKGAAAKDSEKVIRCVRDAGAIVRNTGDGLYVKMRNRAAGVFQIETEVYPGFPTDLQSQVMSVMTTAVGNTTIKEDIFEERFKIVEPLRKMGADIQVNGKMAVIQGVAQLHGETVVAKDLRGGAGLVIAGLMAEGMTTIQEIKYIYRGYENIVRDITALGGHIQLKFGS